MTSQTPSLPNVIINVDLLVSAGNFLDRLDAWRTLFDVAAMSAADPECDRRLRRSIYRYERLWMPLLADWPPSTAPSSNSSSSSSTELEPPADVSWIWHLHQLRPQHYAEFCRQKFSRVLAHRVRPARGQDVNKAVERTSKMWIERYPGVPFEMSTADTGNAAPDNQLAELIIAVARREVDFAYRVALPHIRDQNFLYAAVERYRKWLLLRQLRPNLSPNIRLPVDVELIARVHALYPVQYATDIARLFPSSRGSLPSSVVDSIVSDADFLPAAVDKSNEIWREVFRGEKLFLAGTGHRGRPAIAGIYASPLVEFPRDTLPTNRSTLESCDVSFTEVTVEELWSPSKLVIVEAHLLGENSLVQRTVFRTSGPVGETMYGTSPATPAALGTTHFEAQRNRGIELVVYGRRGFACFARDRKLATKQFNPLQSVGSSGTFESSTTVTLPKVTYTDPKITITFSIQSASQKPIVFTLDRNPATLGPLTSELRQLVGPLPAWSSLITSADSLFVRAKHGLKSREGSLGFGVEVLKHERTNMAAVLLYHNGKDLVSAAYSIDADQLPDPSQVSEMCALTFDVQEGDHAMLIRNRRGDFGVCVARWQQNINSTHGGSSGEGKVVYRLYLASSRQTIKFEVRDDEMSSVRVTTPDGSVEVDLPTGRLAVDANVVPLPEYLTLAFVIGVLFVTIQKSSFMKSQPDSWPTGSVRSAQSGAGGRSSPVISEASSHRSAASRLAAKFQNGGGVGGSNQSISQKRKVTKRRKMSASFTFLLACGLQIDVALFGGGGGNGGGLPTTSSNGSVRIIADQQATGVGDGSVRRMNGNGGSANSTSNGHSYPSNGNGGFVDVRF